VSGAAGWRPDLAQSMTASAILVTGSAVLLLVVIVLRRVTRIARERAAAHRAGWLRPLLHSLVADDEPDPRTQAALVRLDARRWHAIEPTVVSLLDKLTGVAKERLVRLIYQRGALDRALADTHARTPVRRCQAAELLGAAGYDRASGRLAAMLGDPDDEVRLVAARALGRLGDPSNAPALLACLLSDRHVPADVVAASLVQLGPGASPALIAALTDGEARIRSVAAQILGLAGALAGAEALMAAVEHDRSQPVQVQAARALGRIGTPRALPALLSAAGGGRSAALRAAAAQALGELGSAEAVPLLSRIVAIDEHQVASSAATALTMLAEPGRRALRAAGRSGGIAAAHAKEALSTEALRAASATSSPAPAVSTTTKASAS
jgi:HEAT repeat protein